MFRSYLEKIGWLYATFTDYFFTDEDLKVTKIFKAPQYRRGRVVKWALNKNMFVNFSSVVIPKFFFEKVSFRPELRHGEDIIFLLDCVVAGFSWRRVTSDPLLYYRVHSSQGTKTLGRGEFDLCWNLIIPRLHKLGVNTAESRAAYFKSVKSHYPGLFFRMKRKAKNTLRRVV